MPDMIPMPAYIDDTLSDLDGITVTVDKKTNLATITMDVQALNNILVLASTQSHSLDKTRPVDPEKDEYGYQAQDNRNSQTYGWLTRDAIDILSARLSEANELARDNEVRYHRASKKEAEIQRDRRGRAYDIKEAGDLWIKQGLLQPSYAVTANNNSSHAIWLGWIGANVLKDKDLDAIIERLKSSSAPLEPDMVNVLATAIARSGEAKKAEARIRAAKDALK